MLFDVVLVVAVEKVDFSVVDSVVIVEFFGSADVNGSSVVDVGGSRREIIVIELTSITR